VAHDRPRLGAFIGLANQSVGLRALPSLSRAVFQEPRPTDKAAPLQRLGRKHSFDDEDEDDDDCENEAPLRRQGRQIRG
jgi:hypothetical protein